jgi:hypothetical protein
MGNKVNIELKPGDIFCTANPMWLGKAIVFVEKLHSSDNQAEYGHSGIIMAADGTTFEALWTNKKQNLFTAYNGKKILIGRHKRMTPEAFQKGWDVIKNREGEVYAGHRLFLFFIPFLAKYINLGLGVCSELAGKFIAGSGIVSGFWWKGKNPDHIADMIHKWKDWEVVFEGILEGDECVTVNTDGEGI